MIVRHSTFERASFFYPDPRTGPDKLRLSELQTINVASEPLNGMSEVDQDATLRRLAFEVYAILDT